MVQKYVYGTPIETEAVTADVEVTNGICPVGEIDTTNGFLFRYHMDSDMVVYGLGEANRGINKRGYLYISDCADDPDHAENKVSLYGAHNFLLLDGNEKVGLFFDYPSKLRFDIGYTAMDELMVSAEEANLKLYVIKEKTLIDIVREFRKLIGRSYIPPRFAFGYGQSRWGYKTKDDFETVVRKHRENHIPLDMLYMDIDYMDHYKDFTVNNEEFPDFKGFVSEMKQQKIHLIPIIDAGVKVEDGYDVYEEGRKKGYFCKKEDGTPFYAAVWPGYTHFPDVLNKEAREWFGNQYQFLIDAGIDGFWNDMNEPAIFHSPEGLAVAKEKLAEFVNCDTGGAPVWDAANALEKLANDDDDYQRFYHNMDGKTVRHDKVHNLFGYNMTRAASEAFDRIVPNERILIFSRSSYIGMHRYGGIWQGDNKSWWSHLLLNMKMMASLNMCGFLYTGADIGGFGCDTTEDLLMRWLALGVFTPLMRNHAALGTREQEAYRFSHMDDIKSVIEARYRMIPYIYSEFMKAALTDGMYCMPLAFAYEDDRQARHIEDQVMIGNEIMIAPVYTQNAAGRFVYLPENMLFVKLLPGEKMETKMLAKGNHFVEIALNEVAFFVREGKCVPVSGVSETVNDAFLSDFELVGFQGAEYALYTDDGVSKEYDLNQNTRILKYE